MKVRTWFRFIALTVCLYDCCMCMNDVVLDVFQPSILHCLYCFATALMLEIHSLVPIQCTKIGSCIAIDIPCPVVPRAVIS